MKNKNNHDDLKIMLQIKTKKIFKNKKNKVHVNDYS